TPAERAAYEAEWGEFCREMDIARRGRDTAKGRAALLRFRQKAGLIRVDSTAQWIAQQVEAERQVACSVEFVGTAADPITERLQDAGRGVAPIYGRDGSDVEAKRLRFRPARRRCACSPRSPRSACTPGRASRAADRRAPNRGWACSTRP